MTARFEKSRTLGSRSLRLIASSWAIVASFGFVNFPIARTASRRTSGSESRNASARASAD